MMSGRPGIELVSAKLSSGAVLFIRGAVPRAFAAAALASVLQTLASQARRARVFHCVLVFRTL
jgi:hypothetical protein